MLSSPVSSNISIHLSSVNLWTFNYFIYIISSFSFSFFSFPFPPLSFSFLPSLSSQSIYPLPPPLLPLLLYPPLYIPLPLASLSFTIFPFFIVYHSPSVSLSSFSSSLRFFSFSLSSLLWSFAINILEYSSEFLSLFAFIRISLAFSSFPSLISTGLVLFSSLFPSLINCFCSTCSTSIPSNIVLRASSSSQYLSLASSLYDSDRL